MESGNKKHRYSYCGMKGVLEESKHGAQVARERYGKPTASIPKAPDQSRPQFKNDQPLDRAFNDHPNDWVRGKGENASAKPGYISGKK
jgi:hypothetical protein